MDALIDHPATLLPAAPARPARAIADHTFEIGAVLCVALIAATSWAVLAAGWVHGGGGAVVVAVTSVIEAALLAQARAPRIAAAVAAPFLELAAIVPTTLAAMPSVPGQTLGAIVAHYLRALVTGLSSTTDWDFTVGLCAILFLCGYWLGWMALREHRGVLAVVPIFSILATNVINAGNPDDVAVPEVIAVGLSLSVIAAAHLSSLRDRWASARITPLQGLQWRFGSSAAGVAAGLTVLALIIPAVSNSDLSAALFPQGLGLGIGTSPGGTGPGSGTIGFSESVQLGGKLVSEPRPVLTYTTTTNALVYVRVANDTTFDAGNWYPPSRGPVLGGFTWNGVPYQGGTLPRDTDQADGGIGKDETQIVATVVVDQGATGDTPRVPFTGEPEAVNLDGTAYGTVSGADQTSLLSVNSVVLNQNDAGGTTIKTTSLISTATAAELRAAGIGYPQWVEQFTSIPEDVSRGAATITALAKEWTAGATDPYDQAVAIEQHLRNPRLFTYTLNPPRAPVGTWPVVYFLTTSHRGYCQYFASAMGSMLRSLGIPTRLVSGYGPGTTKDINGPAATQALHEQEVTTSDAHSWVEAYFPSYGWIPFEPTPPSSQGDYQPFPRGAAAVITGPQTTPATPKPGPTVKPGNVGGNNPGVTHLRSPHAGAPIGLVVALAILGGIVVLIIGALLWLALPRSLTGAWKRVEALGAISGLDRRRSETHRAYAARLAKARPRAGPALSELAAVTARAEFSAAAPSTHERALALRTWHRALFAVTLRLGRSPG